MQITAEEYLELMKVEEERDALKQENEELRKEDSLMRASRLLTEAADTQCALQKERDSLRQQLDSLAERFKCKREEAVQIALTFATTTDGVLTQLRQQVERMREALRPFAEAVDAFNGAMYDGLDAHDKSFLVAHWPTRICLKAHLTVGHCRAARKAMET